jgi:CIC family chloride channel protein
MSEEDTKRSSVSEQMIDKAQARSELEDYLDTRDQRRLLFPRAALVGLIAGIIGVLFRSLLSAGEYLRESLIHWSSQAPSVGWIVPVLFGAGGAALSVWIVRRYAPETAGSGIPHIEAVLHRLRELRWNRVLPAKLIGGTIALSSGLALGREGPTVQMGGAIGEAIGRWLNSTPRERFTLIACGAGAGLAAAFNAPLAGLVFVLEEIQRDFRPAVFGAAFVASAVADIVMRLLAGQLPVFNVPSYPVPPLEALPIFAVLGVITGLTGVAFNHGLMASLKLFARLHGHYLLVGAAAVGAAAGIFGWFMPSLVGGGHHLAEAVLSGHATLMAIPLLFLIRYLMTLFSYATGAPGGIFAPLLTLGSLIGLGVGLVGNLLFPSAVPQPAAFAVVGMAAMFVGIVRAPLTGIVLIVEMTGSYNQMLPLVVSCFCAYAVAEAVNSVPIYELLLQRDLAHGSSATALTKPMVLDLTIEPGAPFEGKAIRELGLPPGMIIVRCQQGGREWLPTAATRFEAYLRITVAISPEASTQIDDLRRGCEKPRTYEVVDPGGT